MAKTPSGSAASVAAPADLLKYHRWEVIADWLTPQGSERVTEASLNTNAVVLRCLDRAHGDVEAACLVGKKYTADDLAQLTGVGLEYFIGLVCDLAYWHIAKWFRSNTKPEEIAGTQEAFDCLNQLRVGERIFPFEETQQAARTDVVEPVRGSEADIGRTSRLARRFFGKRGE